ncbi:hypothetical protein NEOKW01_0372 [Nematocida sp. AWRm80]|nr:hypothetical protein NEOKW01_0372 [Nematocida sp. AWRm80]
MSKTQLVSLKDLLLKTSIFLILIYSVNCTATQSWYQTNLFNAAKGIIPNIQEVTKKAINQTGLWKETETVQKTEAEMLLEALQKHNAWVSRLPSFDADNLSSWTQLTKISIHTYMPGAGLIIKYLNTISTVKKIVFIGQPHLNPLTKITVDPVNTLLSENNSIFQRITSLVFQNYHINNSPGRLNTFTSLIDLSFINCAYSVEEEIKHNEQGSFILYTTIKKLILSLKIDKIVFDRAEIYYLNKVSDSALKKELDNYKTFSEGKLPDSLLTSNYKVIPNVTIKNTNIWFVHSILYHLKDVDTLALNNNRVYPNLYFLLYTHIFAAIENMTAFALYNEPYILFLEDVLPEFEELITVKLLGINQNIAVPICFFYNDLSAIESIHLDMHVYGMLDMFYNFFLFNKTNIVVYQKNKAEKNVVAMSLQCSMPDVFCLPGQELLYDNTTLNLTLYSDNMALYFPYGNYVRTLVINILFSTELDDYSFVCLCISALNALENLEKIIIKLPFRNIKSKIVNTRLFTLYPTLKLYAIENLFKETLDANLPGIKVREDKITVMGQINYEGTWKTLKNTYYTLYFIDRRYYKIWYSPDKFSKVKNYQFWMLPEKASSSKEKELNEPLKDQASLEICMSCLQSLEPNSDTDISIRDVNNTTYIDVIKQHTFVVLQCGHQLCSKCAIEKGRSKGVYKTGADMMLSAASYIPLIKDLSMNRILPQHTGTNRPASLEALKDIGTQILFCPVANCDFGEQYYYIVRDLFMNE